MWITESGPVAPIRLTAILAQAHAAHLGILPLTCCG